MLLFFVWLFTVQLVWAEPSLDMPFQATEYELDGASPPGSCRVKVLLKADVDQPPHLWLVGGDENATEMQVSTESSGGWVTTLTVPMQETINLNLMVERNKFTTVKVRLPSATEALLRLRWRPCCCSQAVL